MADLEDMLLEAAGRTSKSSRKSKSHRHARWNQEGPCSDASDSDEDDGNKRLLKGNHSSSSFPVKKRYETSRKDQDVYSDYNDKSSGDDSDSAPSVGSDLYKDDRDKEELAKMSELAREMILAERSTKIDDYRLKKRARESSSNAEKVSMKESPPPLPSRTRPSLRSDKASAKSDALNELRLKRMKQQGSDSYRKFNEFTGGTGIIFNETTNLSESEGGSSTDGNEDKFNEYNDAGDNVDDLLTSSPPLGFDDVKDITIRRSKLVKWFMEPFFEDIIVGCFVRVGIAQTRAGPKYQLCLVKSVDASDPERQYKLEGRTTHKWLNCTWGNEATAARWQMAVVSDSPPLEDEFAEWIAEVERSGGKMPNLQDVNNKKMEIYKLSNFVYSAAMVKQMLEEKKSASNRPRNFAAEKDRLRKEIELAETLGDDFEVKRLRTKMKELEELSRQSKLQDVKAIRLAEMNKRNRAQNFRNASERKPVNTSLKAGEEGYDPFSRRWTRSSNYYLSKPGSVSGEVDGSDQNSNIIASSDATNVISPANIAKVGTEATEATPDSEKLVDTNAPVDKGTESNFLHNFDLPISLAALQAFGGPHGVSLGYMSRKQRIEATIGYKVPENDGKRHSLTLTVSDYKRRRGLL
ncbi:hypothetical protein AXF42_Ash013948 [Apostasia shenzhenica]|uniref:Plus3 domain-containing protein n=1 Tax=Apostasia shenzhenica TaxID=1088818 RepID=A0A2I0ASD0_9ASPA|nr:hypothetical protein AXF42_Ash013948 [Apostasia shenzhenica]